MALVSDQGVIRNNMNGQRYYSIFIVLMATIFISCAVKAPLPTSLKIFEVPPNTSPQVATFLGVWEGQWEGALDTILVVSKISNDKADVIYSLGDQGGSFIIPQNKYASVTATIHDGFLEWIQPNGHKYVFEMDNGLKKLKGYFIDGNTGGKLRAFLKKVEIDEVTKSKIYYYRYPPSRSVFTTGLNQNNEPIDTIDKISLKTKRIYLYVNWYDLVPGRHDYKIEIYDGAENLLYSGSMIIEPTGSSYNTWTSYDIKQVDQAGLWNYKVYFDNKIAVYKRLEVLAE